jgi:Icc-related predicted phosphoesterase
MKNSLKTIDPPENPEMRIVCISDTHGLHRKLVLPEADILIHAGDFMVHGRSTEEIDDFNEWLGSLPYRHRIVIAGNHDLLFESSPAEARDHLYNAVYLENAGITLEGISFWGCPVTPVLPQWAFSAERGADKYWDKVPARIDVLVTHGPPFGTLDKDDILSPHMGCKQLTKAVLRVKPRLHVFGHVHGGYGQETGPNGTYFVNCAALRGATLNSPVVIEFGSGPRASE